MMKPRSIFNTLALTFLCIAGLYFGYWYETEQPLEQDAINEEFEATGDIQAGLGDSNQPVLPTTRATTTASDGTTIPTSITQRTASNGWYLGNNVTTTGNLTFMGELMPDGLTCSTGQILQKAGTNDWDCATVTSGGSPDWITIFNETAIRPSSTRGIFVSASSTINADFRVTGNATNTGSVALTGYPNCTVKTDGNGLVLCGTDNSGGAGSSNWHEFAVNVLTPTNTSAGLWIRGSTTIANLFQVYGGVTTTESLQIGKNLQVGEYINVSGSASSTITSGLVIDSTTFVVNANENRVGIGTASPTTTFGVSGSSRFNGTVAISGQTTLTGYASCNLDTDANGLITCGTDATGSGGDAFTHATVFGQETSATSTLIYLTGSPYGLAVSTTAALTQASTTQVSISDLLYFDSLIFDSLTDDATLDNNAGDLRVVDVTCTDCLNATEIEDIYFLTAGDVMANGTSTDSFDANKLGLDSTFITSWDSDATIAISGGALQVVDVTCTDCLNATEIEDIYFLTAGDTMANGTSTDSFQAGKFSTDGSIYINNFAGDGLIVTANALLFDCSDVASTGLQCSGEDLQLNATGDWTGTLDGFQGVDLNNIVFTADAGYGQITSATTTALELNASPIALTASGTIAFVNASGTAITLNSIHIGSDDLNELVGVGLVNNTGSLGFDCSDVEGTGINCTGEAITLDATGNWTGTFDGFEGVDLLALRPTSTTRLGATLVMSSPIYTPTTSPSSLYISQDFFTHGNATTTGFVTFSQYPSCTALETDDEGVVVCGSDADSGAGTGSNWVFLGSQTAIRPSTSVGIFINASSTLQATTTIAQNAGNTYINSKVLQVGDINNKHFFDSSGDGSNLIYLAKDNFASDASVLFGGAGWPLWEFGAAGGDGYDLYMKRVSTTTGSLVYENVWFFDYQTGRWGFGTEAPSSLFEVASTSPTARVDLRVVNKATSGTDGSSIQLAAENDGHVAYFGTDAGLNGGQNIFINYGSFGTGLFIDSAGNVGSNDTSLTWDFESPTALFGNATSTVSLTVGSAVAANSINFTGGDLYVQNDAQIAGLIYSAGITGTGVNDFGGASSFEIPNGTGNTVDAVGEIALDTDMTTGHKSLIVGTSTDATGPAVIPLALKIPVHYASTTWTGTTTINYGGGATHPFQLNTVYCFSNAGTAIVRIGDGTNWSNNVPITTAQASTTLTTNVGFTYGEKVQIQIGSPLTAVASVGCTFEGFYNRL